ncbi:MULTISPECIES: GNAT family N-acetyltransferase [unclassified Sphingopyxis]|uniref:GNAT family N-acetyltransferase n=1 Tax=unclassified Sphingopyxis TaxID=2614943 RepID=UPI0007316449|nr:MULTISPECIES: GNAT family N-acetyltransferase [unclassified Sphingopyxis]KTE02029.1 GNAT family acetyltransferase [Sphingopyxis sp. H012]KTE09777.1 GNAT family acetyltransferase [Sphingopyxis sp. H053]KTE15172.1 GNAT family acetyltransferase [Sphingopyxis sp. H093]KTE29879.1 GNAT family acetyltransferase [Sphingopyxis sp. H080]KTE32891.1 GNAT family acetyltransferase [Sphingopyxis sp. H038]
MSNLVLRDAAVADLPAILAMLAEETIPPGREADPSDPRYLSAFAAIDADPNQRLIAAELDGRVVGTMQLSFLPGLSFIGSWRGLIEAVRIVADLRGQKLGEHMILWAVEQCRARDCKLVQLTSSATRTDAHRFYARLGFVQSHVGMKLHLRD